MGHQPKWKWTSVPLYMDIGVVVDDQAENLRIKQSVKFVG